MSAALDTRSEYFRRRGHLNCDCSFCMAMCCGRPMPWTCRIEKLPLDTMTKLEIQISEPEGAKFFAHEFRRVMVKALTDYGVRINAGYDWAPSGVILRASMVHTQPVGPIVKSMWRSGLEKVRAIDERARAARSKQFDGKCNAP